MDSGALSISRETSSLRNQVASSIREAILKGQLPPGEKLVERDLCETLGVSRTLLREALQHLRAEGLLTGSSYRSTSVAELTKQDAKDIYRVREVLEGLAGEGFARHASPEQMQRLRATIEKLRHIDPLAATDELLQAKNLFYATLVEGCGNRLVGQILVQLNNRITLLRRMSLAQPGRLPQTLQEMTEIMEALESRDARKARALCSNHVRKAAKAAEKRFLRKSTDHAEV
ncbi:MAG: GntR family transcriptional regulator [Castellaniella sp.]|nr:MAG: GntR family transcriptional regulator [Castellaniella sp.]